MKIVNQLKTSATDISVSEILQDPKENNALVMEADDQLGCTVLQGFIDSNGQLQFINDNDDTGTAESSPCLSSSFLNKRKSIPGLGSAKKRKSSKPDPKEIEPMAILPILKETEAGRKVIDFIMNNGFLDQRNQVQLMRIIHDHFTCDKESPIKYYPHTASKIAIVKGIVVDFPQLADSGDCPWASWLKIVTTKFETVQAALPPCKRKNRPANSTDSSLKLNSRFKPPYKPTVTATVTSQEMDETPENVESQQSQKLLMKDLMPTKANRAVISLALSSTFGERKKWIREAKPTCTAILDEYKHLASYQGAMISEEFLRLQPLHENLVAKFSIVSPYILKYAEVVKPALLIQATEKFGSGTVTTALVLLPKLINVTLNKNTVSQAHLDHIKKYKGFIEGIPSSALFQTAPEGTDVESFDSVESSRNPEEFSPIFPFLLWVTSDYQRGKIYLKIDKKVLLLCDHSPESKDHMVIAVDLLVKVQHIFNLEYHPYLKSFYEYIEFIMGIKSDPINSVKKFVSAVRQLSMSQ